MPPDDDDLLTYAAGWRERAGARARREAALRRARSAAIQDLLHSIRCICVKAQITRLPPSRVLWVRWGPRWPTRRDTVRS
jgi:hypothetical protein